MTGRVLLLGGRGFIGTALSPILQAAGWQPIIAGRDDVLQSALDDCTAVVHLACSTTPGSSARNPLLEMDNLALTLRLLNALNTTDGIQIIFLSSGGAVYGNPTNLPVAEAAPLAPLSWHAAGKAAAEALLAAHRTGPVTVLRVANAYGPTQPQKPGFGFVRAVMDCALTGQALGIWGDGQTVRDFVFVEDVAKSILAALEHRNRTGVFNVGSGVGHSLNQVVTLARAVTGIPIEVLYRPARQTDVSAVVLDIAHARHDLEWQAEVSLEEGLRRTWVTLERNR